MLSRFFSVLFLVLISMSTPAIAGQGGLDLSIVGVSQAEEGTILEIDARNQIKTPRDGAHLRVDCVLAREDEDAFDVVVSSDFIITSPEGMEEADEILLRHENIQVVTQESGFPVGETVHLRIVIEPREGISLSSCIKVSLRRAW